MRTNRWKYFFQIDLSQFIEESVQNNFSSREKRPDASSRLFGLPPRVSSQLTFEIVLHRIEVFVVELGVAAGRVAVGGGGGGALQVGRGGAFLRGVGVA